MADATLCWQCYKYSDITPTLRNGCGKIPCQRCTDQGLDCLIAPGHIEQQCRDFEKALAKLDKAREEIPSPRASDLNLPKVPDKSPPSSATSSEDIVVVDIQKTDKASSSSENSPSTAKRTIGPDAEVANAKKIRPSTPEPKSALDELHDQYVRLIEKLRNHFIDDGE